jgi:hypothetical protein
LWNLPWHFGLRRRHLVLPTQDLRHRGLRLQR